MKKFWIGLVVGVVLVPLAGFVFVLMGGMPVATSAPPLPMERLLANMAVHEKESSQAPKVVPIELTEANFLAGAQLYKQHCSECHGLPEQPTPENIAGMYPHVPQFFKPRHFRERGGKAPQRRGPPPESMVKRFVAGIYWRTKNGTRLTGMPSFEKALTEQQMWQVSAFLSQRFNMTAALTAALTAPPAASGTPPAPESKKPAPGARKK